MATALLLALPYASASCSSSASVSIALPAGTVVSQTTVGSYIDLVVVNTSAGCAGTSPRMQNTSVTFGALTQQGYGEVRLSAMDNYNFAHPFSGLGLLQYGSVVPQNWTVSVVSGNASHWIVPPQMVGEGPLAITPTPSAAGVSAALNNGPYIFLVQAYNATGLYDSAYLTYNIKANAANVGAYDIKASFKVNPAVDTLLISTGADMSLTGAYFTFANFTNTVTFRNADTARPAGLAYFQCNTCNNWIVSDLVFTGDLVVSGCFIGILGFLKSTNMAAYHLASYFTLQTQSFVSVIGLSGCVNCYIDDVYGFGVNSGILDDGRYLNYNITISRFKLRQFSNNGMFLGNAINMTIIDAVTMAPMHNSGAHTDHLQVAAQQTCQNLTVIRLQQYNAEGSGSAQGFFSGQAGNFIGFIDNGSGNGTFSNIPGTILTLTSPSIFPLTGGFFHGDKFPVLQVGDKLSSTSYRLKSSTPMLAPIGNISDAPHNNLILNGFSYVGATAACISVKGTSGQSLINAFTGVLVNNLPQDIPIAYFMATVINKILTVTSWNLSNTFPISAPSYIQLADGSALAASTGLVVVGSDLQSCTSGTNDCTGTNHTLLRCDTCNYPTPTAFRVLGDLILSPQAGPNIIFNSANFPGQYAGQNTVSNGYMWSTLNGAPNYLSVSRLPTTKPAGITVNNCVFQDHNNTYQAECFAQGDPELGPQGLEQITDAEWATMSFAEVLAKHAKALTPKAGGPLASGGPTVGAFTVDGKWNDGSNKDPVNSCGPGNY